MTVDGKIVAMLLRGRLVVKLPRERCLALVESGDAEFVTIAARTLREWIAIEPGRGDWLALARDALAFVRP